MAIPVITVDDLLGRYDGLLLDAYGVLVTTGGAVPGAAPFVERLGREGKPFVVLTNDASRTPETAAARYQSFGLAIDVGQVVTSGMLLAGFFRERGLQGARCLALGTRDTRAYVEQAGGVPIEIGKDDEDIAVIVVGDDIGFSLLDGVNHAVTAGFRALDSGRPLELVLPNPDIVYPRAPGAWGVTAGAIALMIEAALEARYRDAAPRFVGLGKPNPAIFEAGLERLGDVPRERVVMVGDQLDTDIRGARGVGLDAVLVGTGVSRATAADGPRPHATLAGLSG